MKIDEPDTPYNYYNPELVINKIMQFYIKKDEQLEKEDFDPEIIALSKTDFTTKNLDNMD